MTIHKVQGLTCDKIAFHSNSVPTVAFAYLALSRVRHGNAILLTQSLTLKNLKSSPDKLATLRQRRRTGQQVRLQKR
ncbi:P-loop containing nucleoside triphosphate hydrolase [Phytophthora cactorum]|nr:P-loop containing nucleoside triphosphate hydrolase [Phytophthora cactorum]